MGIEEDQYKIEISLVLVNVIGAGTAADSRRVIFKFLSSVTEVPSYMLRVASRMLNLSKKMVIDAAPTGDMLHTHCSSPYISSNELEPSVIDIDVAVR